MALPKGAPAIDQVWQYKSSLSGVTVYKIVDIMPANLPCHPGLDTHVHLASINGKGSKNAAEIDDLLQKPKWTYEAPSVAAYGGQQPTPKAAIPVTAKAPVMKAPAPFVPLMAKVSTKQYEVSTNGRDWVRYSLLDDADPVEKYKFHREI